MDSLIVIDSSPLRTLSLISSSFSNTSFSLFKFKKSKAFKKSKSFPITAAANALSPQNPPINNFINLWNNNNFPIKPFSYLIPFFTKLKDLALKSSKQKWASIFQDFPLQETDFLQNGTFGSALMSSVTTTAKVKISPFVSTLAANPTFVSGLCAWAAAQSMKVFLNFVMEKRWDFKIMFASGGMPSSHSALCTALTTSVAICHGVADSLFPVCLGFTLIVMYDATGVRRHAGMQAEVLNLIVGVLFQGHPISERKLKELLGHTPSQVFAGAMLGIVVAWMCCQACLVPV